MTDLVDLPNPENSTDLNEDNYDDLIVSIEASVGKLSLLIAVCDDVNFRNQIIDRYETELQPETRPYRVTLDRKEPSLRAAIAQLIQSDDYLQKNSKAIITVTGTEELYFLRLGEERSEQEIFFGYLQWTREALREFHYPIVLWVNNQILNSLIKQAPDFWSWRKGVFYYSIKNSSKLYQHGSGDKVIMGDKLMGNKIEIQITNNLQGANIANFANDIIDNARHSTSNSIQTNNTKVSEINTFVNIFKKASLKEISQYLDLQISTFKMHDDEGEAFRIKIFKGLIDEELDNKSSRLVGLYEGLAEIYVKRLASGKPQIYKTEQDIAIQYLQNAITLRKELDLRNGLDNSLAKLGSLYESQGEFEQAKQLYSEALDILQAEGNYSDVIIRLNNLAGIEHSQGHYEAAVKLYNQSLAIYEDGKDTDITTYASTMNFLAGTYHAQGKYVEAEQIYKKALKIRIKAFGGSHADVAVSLNNLGLLYSEQGKFIEAESYYQQALGIQIKLLSDTNPDIATSLNNLALLYYAQGRLTEAESYLVDALKIRQKLLGDSHPDVAGSLNNLAGLYKAQGRFTEANALYEEALAIATTSLGSDHPITLRFQESLAKLREQLSLSQKI